MTFKVLIIEDNHSFIDSLKVMLRDLPLDFSHAFRYADAIALIDKIGVFPIHQAQGAIEVATEQVEAMIGAAESGKKKGNPPTPKLYNEAGIFLFIIEQNTETNMKGIDFIAHAVKKYPGLSEGDFILLTHRIESLPTKNFVFPVIEKPLRAPQIRQVVAQRIKHAQDLIDMQARLEAQKIDVKETAASTPTAKRKGLRDLLKINRSEDNAVADTPDTEKTKKVNVKPKKAAKLPRTKKTAKAKP